jgi:hypothetical protein
MRVVLSAYGRRIGDATRGAVAGPRHVGVGARAAGVRGGQGSDALVAAGVLPAGVWR